nr:Glyco_hydro_20 [uncultured Bacteroides sp.]
MNTFHWHLTEDQGWRIEIKKYPKLTEIGSIRERTVVGRNTQEYDNTPHAGFYTQEQAKRDC